MARLLSADVLQGLIWGCLFSEAVLLAGVEGEFSLGVCYWQV